MKEENPIVRNEVSVNPLESIEFNENEYKKLLQQTVEVIEHARIQVAKQVNTTVTSSYWEIGKLLTELKVDSKYGDRYVKRLSVDLKKIYPNMGVSPRNLYDMKRFYHLYCQEDRKVRQAVALLPWGHILLLMSSNIIKIVKDTARSVPTICNDKRLYFASQFSGLWILRSFQTWK